MDDFFEDDPLDLDGDGDHVIEMCMLYDNEESGTKRPRPSGGRLPGAAFHPVRSRSGGIASTMVGVINANHGRLRSIQVNPLKKGASPS